MNWYRWMITFCKKVLWRIGQFLTAFSNDCGTDEKRAGRDDKYDELAYRVDILMLEKKLFLKHNLTLDLLAQEIGTNRTYLSRMFNQKKKMSYLSYLNGLRLDYAISLSPAWTSEMA